MTIDRDTAGRLGVTPATIDNIIYDAFGQRLVSTIYTQSNQYRVVIEVKPEYRKGPDVLNELFVPSSFGTQVRLDAVAKVSELPAPLVINHLGQFPAATISFNLAAGASLGDAVKAVESAQQELGVPARCTSFRAQRSLFAPRERALLILAAVITMYIVLGVLYESYIHPVTISPRCRPRASARCWH